MGNLFSSSRISTVRVGNGNPKSMTRQEVVDLLKQIPGVNDRTKFIINDRDYIAPEEDRIDRYLKDDKTNKLKYKLERSDCDDFTRVFLGRMAENVFKYGSKGDRGIAVGEIQGKLYIEGEPINHSMVVAIVNRDGTSVPILIEPQNDKKYGFDNRSVIWSIHV